MLFEQTKLKIFLLSTFFGLTAGLTGCGNSAQLEGFLRADPNLSTANEKGLSKLSTTSQEDADSERIPLQKEIKLTKLPKKLSGKANTEVTDLPRNFPLYPQATLELITPESTAEKGVSQWRSPDAIEKIISYYQQKWQDQDWEVIEPFTLNQNTRRHTAIVSQDNIDFTLFLTPASQAERSEKQKTNLEIIYQTTQANSIDVAETQKPIIANNDDVSNDDRQSSNNLETEANTSQVTTQESNQTQTTAISDVPEAPEQLQQYIQDVVALGITQSIASEDSADTSLFQPNEVITRGEYAQWLVKANNEYYGDSSGNKIRLANTSSEPVFKDISISDPRFAAIQGLAEAGLIPSMLTGDSSSLLFQPDAPLTREDLIAWKTPLDIRQGLPKADAIAIKEAWGFQDASKIDPLVLSALFADYQNGDRSNLKRIFGYTILFQPQKSVTRAEAAASLWHFGYQGDGITAREKLKQNSQTINN